MKTYASVIRSMGYCCSLDFLEKHSKWTTKEIGEKLGLAPRTIRLNKQIAREETECPNRAHCAKILRPLP